MNYTEYVIKHYDGVYQIITTSKKSVVYSYCHSTLKELIGDKTICNSLKLDSVSSFIEQKGHIIFKREFNEMNHKTKLEDLIHILPEEFI
jgi:hypothetical protein